MYERAYVITTPIHGPGESSTYYVTAPTSRKGASKARMEALRNAWDAGFEISFKDVKVRSIGMQRTPLEIAQAKCDAFNARYGPGTMVKCYPAIPPSFEDEDLVKVLEIRELGAYVMRSGCPVACVKGDQWAIEAVLPIYSAPAAVVDPNPVIYDEGGVAF